MGSTAVAVVLHTDEKSSKSSLITANIGDSRAVLSRRGRAVDLTKVKCQSILKKHAVLFVMHLMVNQLLLLRITNQIIPRSLNVSRS